MSIGDSLDAMNKIFGALCTEDEHSDAVSGLTDAEIVSDPTKLLEAIKSDIGGDTKTSVDSTVVAPKKKKSTSKKTKKNTDNLSDDILDEVKTLSQLKDSVVGVRIATALSIGEFSTDITESWQGLLTFLVGCIALREGAEEKFLSAVSNSGILNENIVLHKKSQHYLDKQLSNTDGVFNIPYTGYKLDFYKSEAVLLASIKKAVKNLGFKNKDVDITVRNPEIITSGGNQLRIAEGLELVTHSETLFNLANDGIPESFNLVSISLDGQEEEVISLKHGIVFLLGYLFIMEEDRAIQAAVKRTVVDVVGVTYEPEKYLGVINTYELPNTRMKFFTNGESNKMIHFISQICCDIGIDIHTIELKYTTLQFKER